MPWSSCHTYAEILGLRNSVKFTASKECAFVNIAPINYHQSQVYDCLIGQNEKSSYLDIFLLFFFSVINVLN
jgi:hypothetical protein